MSDLSRDARDLIAKARPAERAGASAKQRVRASLVAQLGPALPVAAAAAAGSGLSALKLVLICSLATAGVVGTTALVKTRHASGRGQRSVPRAIPAVVAPAILPGQGDPEPPPVTPLLSVEPGGVRPALPDPDGEPVRRGTPRPRPARTPDPVELPFPMGMPAEPTSAQPPEAQTFLDPRSDVASPSSSWRPSDLPAPVARRDTTRITSVPGEHPRCSTEREVKLLSAAQAALREADGRRAMDLLDQHAETCPMGTFWQERSAARVLALCLLNRTPQALTEAARLASLAPRSPLLARLRTSCAAAAVKP